MQQLLLSRHHPSPVGVIAEPGSLAEQGVADGFGGFADILNDLFGGGAGAGINLTPVAFLTIKDGQINLLPVVSKPDTFDRLVSLVPDAVNKVSDLFKKKDEKED